MGKATRASLWRQSCQKKNTNRFLLDKYEKIRTSWIRIFLSFFFFNERPRSLASPFGRFRFSLSYSLRARSNATSCDFASRPRPRPNDIYIYRSNSFGWKDGRLPATGEDTFVDVYLLRRGFRAKAAPTTAEGKLKKTLLPGNNGLRSRAWVNVEYCRRGKHYIAASLRGETLPILSSGELLRAYQGCEDTICYYYYYILEHNFDISSPSKEFYAFSQIKT